MISTTPHHQSDRAIWRLLKLLDRYRLLAEDQLKTLFGHHLPDLDTLAEQRVILVRNFPRLDRPPIRVLALARRGAEALALWTGEEVSAFRYLTPARFRRSLFTLEHELKVAELGLVAEQLVASREDLKLLCWTTRREQLAEAVLVSTPKEPKRVPLVADAFFGLRYRGEPSFFLLELDRGTVSLSRMREKLRGYATWWQEGGPERRFGVKSLRLLLVVPSEARLTRLRAAARQAAQGPSIRRASRGLGLFWLATHQVLDLKHPERFLSPLWQTTKSDKPQPLLSRCPGP